MQIIKEETKKLFHPITVLILVGFTALFSFSFIIGPEHSVLTSITTMHVPSDWVKTSRDIIDIAGPTIEDAEVDSTYTVLSNRYLKEMNAAIRKSKSLKAAGVHNYDDYRKLYEKITYSDVTPDMAKMEEAETGEPFALNGYPPYDPTADYTLTPEENYIAEENFFGSMIGSIDQKYEYINGFHLNDEKECNLLSRSIRYYKNILNYGSNDESSTPFEKKVYKELSSSESWRVIMPFPIVESVFESMKMLLFMIIITICLLFGPLVMRDQMNGMVYIQNSCKQGRKILNYQLSTVLILTFLLVTFEIAIVAAVFRANGWGVFWDYKLNSFLNFDAVTYFSGTLGEYFLVIVCMAYLLAFACALIVFVISKTTKNYISMLLGIIPWGALCCLLTITSFPAAFFIRAEYPRSNLLYLITRIPYIEFFACSLLFVIAVIVTIHVCRRNKREDIL